jgi:hypothetical protein
MTGRLIIALAGIAFLCYAAPVFILLVVTLIAALTVATTR